MTPYAKIKGYDRMRELAPHLGEEVKSAFISDRDTKQYLVGLHVYPPPHVESMSNELRWVAEIRLSANGHTQEMSIGVDGVQLLEKE